LLVTSTNIFSGEDRNLPLGCRPVWGYTLEIYMMPPCLCLSLSEYLHLYDLPSLSLYNLSICLCFSISMSHPLSWPRSYFCSKPALLSPLHFLCSSILSHYLFFFLSRSNITVAVTHIFTKKLHKCSIKLFCLTASLILKSLRFILIFGFCNR
jgi:hypothetical protein